MAKMPKLIFDDNPPDKPLGGARRVMDYRNPNSLKKLACMDDGHVFPLLEVGAVKHCPRCWAVQ